MIWMLFLNGALAEPFVLDRLSASVNNASILLSDVARFRSSLRLRGQLDPFFSDSPLAKLGPVPDDKDVVDFLVNERLIASQLPVTDGEVEQEINSIQANNHFSRKELLATLVQQGFSFEQYFELIRASISKRNLVDRDIRTKVRIADDDIKNYFYNTSDSDRGQHYAYRIKLIAVQPKNYRSLADARAYLTKVRLRVLGGESFDDVAKELSDDPSAAQGGDLGFLPESDLAPKLRKAVRDLKVGEVSPVLGDGSGIFFLKLADLKSGKEDRLNEKREQIRETLAKAEFQRQMDLWIEREKQGAVIYVHGK